MSSPIASRSATSRLLFFCPTLLRFAGDAVVGKKILDPGAFFQRACEELATYDGPLPSPEANEEWSMQLSEAVIPLVSSDVGATAGRTEEDYVVRKHNGYMVACLRRSFALPASGVWVKVVPSETYRKRYLPKIAEEERPLLEAIRAATHVIVDVVITVGPVNARVQYPDLHQFLMKIANHSGTLGSIFAGAKRLISAGRDYALVAD